MRPREGPRAHLAVDVHDLWDHRLRRPRPLPVPKLAHVEVAHDAVDPFQAVPTQEDVARRLHEPLPLDHPLRNLPNTVITPHLGYVTEEGYRIFYGHALEDVKGWLAGQPVRVLKP